MKTITVIGANGRTGIEIVKLAIEKGWIVKALVREKQKMNMSNHNLQIIEGNPMSYDDVAKAVKETDAVFVALNIGRKTDMPWSKIVSPLDLFDVSMKNTIKAMKENGVKRVITVSAWGTGDSYKETNLMFKFLIKRTNVGHAYAGHDDQEKILRQSGMDWTSVRPVGLNDKQEHKEVLVRMGKRDPLKMTISRKDVAKFMIDIIDDPQYFKKTPAISNK